MPRTVISLNEDNSFSQQYSHNPYAAAAPQHAPSYGVVPMAGQPAAMMNTQQRQANAGTGYHHQFQASTNSNTSSSQSFFGSERSQNSGPSFNGSDYGDEVQSQEGGSSLNAGSDSVVSYNTEGTNGMPMMGRQQRGGKVDPSRFKTETCAFYVRGEPCPYSPFCAFAHGDEERRSRRRNVREGVTKVNTLPRHMVYHEVWVQTTKYTRKTGPAEGANAGAPVPKVSAPPAPSFVKSQRPTA